MARAGTGRPPTAQARRARAFLLSVAHPRETARPWDLQTPQERAGLKHHLQISGTAGPGPTSPSPVRQPMAGSTVLRANLQAGARQWATSLGTPALQESASSRR